jgi:hypothetical protein
VARRFAQTPKVREHSRGVLPIRMSDDNESKPAPALGPAVLRAIGRELRAIYADIIIEGVPERFAARLGPNCERKIVCSFTCTAKSA